MACCHFNSIRNERGARVQKAWLEPALKVELIRTLAAKAHCSVRQATRVPLVQRYSNKSCFQKGSNKLRHKSVMCFELLSRVAQVQNMFLCWLKNHWAFVRIRICVSCRQHNRPEYPDLAKGARPRRCCGALPSCFDNPKVSP